MVANDLQSLFLPHQNTNTLVFPLTQDTYVGSVVGTKVESADGLDDGNGVGIEVGRCVGNADGSWVGR